MRYLYVFFMLALIITGINTHCRAQNSFEILLEAEGESYSGISRMIETSDGNYVGVYKKVLYTNTGSAVYEHLIKISPEGDITTYLFPKEDTIVSILRVLEASANPIQYFIYGKNYPYGHSNLKNEFFMLLNENFDIIWEKQYKLSAYEYTTGGGSNVMRLTDGSYLYASDPGNGYHDYMYFFHLSPDGDSLSFRSYESFIGDGTDSAGYVMCLTYSPDSSCYWIHTLFAHDDNTTRGAAVIEMNQELEQTNVMHYPRLLGQNYYAKVLPNNKLVVGGHYWDTGFTLASFIVDSNLNVLAEDYVTHPDTTLATTGKCLDYYYPNHIYVGGTHYRSSWGEFPTWFVVAKYNEELELIYERYIGDSANYWLLDVAATSDSGVILSGTRYDYWEPVTKKKAVLMKLSPDGLLVGNEEITTGAIIKKAIVYPNPGGNTLSLRTALRNSTFMLFNIQGKLVLEQKVTQLISNYNTAELPNSVYTWTISNDKQLLESGKWLKQE